MHNHSEQKKQNTNNKKLVLAGPCHKCGSLLPLVAAQYVILFVRPHMSPVSVCPQSPYVPSNYLPLCVPVSGGCSVPDSFCMSPCVPSPRMSPVPSPRMSQVITFLCVSLFLCVPKPNLNSNPDPDTLRQGHIGMRTHIRMTPVLLDNSGANCQLCHSLMV